MLSLQSEAPLCQSHKSGFKASTAGLSLVTVLVVCVIDVGKTIERPCDSRGEGASLGTFSVVTCNFLLEILREL